MRAEFEMLHLQFILIQGIERAVLLSCFLAIVSYRYMILTQWRLHMYPLLKNKQTNKKDNDHGWQEPPQLVELPFLSASPTVPGRHGT